MSIRVRFLVLCVLSAVALVVANTPAQGALLTSPPLASALTPIATASPLAPTVGRGTGSDTGWTGLERSAATGSVLLSGSPAFPPVADPGTHTLYVPIQCTDPSTNQSCNATASTLVDVIDTAVCHAAVSTGCRVVTTATVARGATTALMDPSTDTLYVGTANGELSVVDGATCNASVTRGCSRPLATIHLAGLITGAAIDPSTGTLYATSLANEVFVVDAGGCNATNTADCKAPVREIADPQSPTGAAVDPATDTVYAVNQGVGGANGSVWVIDGATCNATTQAGCGQHPPSIGVGLSSQWDVFDPATDTVYVANTDDGTVSVIDGATCNATTHMGCGQTPLAVTTGSTASFIALDPSLHTLFAINQGDDTLSEIDTRTCNGADQAGCPARARNQHLNFNPPHGGNANTFALVPQTETAYLVNSGGENLLQPVGVGRCSATDTTGCRHEAPAIPGGLGIAATLDPSTDTIYAGNLTLPQIDVINATTCHAGRLEGCAPVATIPMADPQANVGAIDPRTDTLYASDPFSDTVSAIDTASCNAEHPEGCSGPWPSMTVGPFPGSPVLEPSTGTLYVPFEPTGVKVGVLDASTCNAQVMTGCGQSPTVVNVGLGTDILAIDTATDTVYAPNSGGPGFTGDTVEVIDGQTCNATDHAGCGGPIADFAVGTGPFGVAVNQATHTVYVANNDNGDSPGTVSVIDASTCRAGNTAGCTGPHPTISVGRSPLEVAVNPVTDEVIVSDNSSAAVSEFDGATCNGEVSSGCATPAVMRPTGSGPFSVLVDPRWNTVYAGNLFRPDTTSIFSGPR